MNAPQRRKQSKPAVGAPTVIDVTRPYAVLAICHDCGMRRELPEDWRTILEPTMPPGWDGQLRCRNGHTPRMMVLIPVRNPRTEVDSSVVVHLVMDDDRRRAVCTGQLWAGVPDNLPAGTVLRLCVACIRTVLRS